MTNLVLNHGSVRAEDFGDGVDGLSKQFSVSQRWQPVVPKSAKPGRRYATPVNLHVSITESPNPTRWLQKVAKYVDEHKDEAKEDFLDALDASRRIANEREEILAQLEIDKSAAEACTAAITDHTAWATVPASQPDLQAVADVKAKASHVVALSAWEVSSYALQSLCWGKPTGGA